jgi:hypothetical protein
MAQATSDRTSEAWRAQPFPQQSPFGPILTAYPPNARLLSAIRSLSAVLIVIAAIGLVAGLVSASRGQPNGIPVLVMGLAGGMAGVISLLAARRLGSQRLIVCGQALVGQDGDRAWAIPWDEIVEVRQDLWPRKSARFPEQRPRRCKIVTRSGATREFRSSFCYLGELSRLIQHETTRRLWPSAWERYTRGEQLAFGSLSLNMHGISHRGVTCLWERVVQVEASGLTITIRTHDRVRPWGTIRISETPNVTLLLRLSRRAIAGARLGAGGTSERGRGDG